MNPREALNALYNPLPYWYRVDSAYQNALLLIKYSVQGEPNRELFYDELIKSAPSDAQRNIIISIRDDERLHMKIFRQIYLSLTGEQITGISNEEYKQPKSFLEGIQHALFGELTAVEKYREIWTQLPQGQHKDNVMGIIIDKLKHASIYNYFYTLNK